MRAVADEANAKHGEPPKIRFTAETAEDAEEKRKGEWGSGRRLFLCDLRVLCG
jgi:hypothetical protein